MLSDMCVVVALFVVDLFVCFECVVFLYLFFVYYVVNGIIFLLLIRDENMLCYDCSMVHRSRYLYALSTLCYVPKFGLQLEFVLCVLYHVVYYLGFCHFFSVSYYMCVAIRYV